MPDHPDSASEENAFYNLPERNFGRRGDEYAAVISQFNEDGRPLRILEIGVYRANLIQALMGNSAQTVERYLGVDPYLGTKKDPYFRSYWKSDSNVAEQTYAESKAVFEKLGGELLRQTSDKFFKRNRETFDVVIVDGDHRFEQALRDMENGLKILADGGLLVCDDYGNSDTPDVTKAINTFWDRNPDFFDHAGYRPLWFQNAGKHIPIQLSIVYWRKHRDPSNSGGG